MLNLGLRLLGIGKWILSILEAVGRWIFEDFRHMVIVVLAFLNVWGYWGWHDAEDEVAVLTVKLDEEIEAKKAWIAAYQDFIAAVEAQREEARRLDLANKARVDAEQRRTIERTRREYQARLDATAVAAQRLRDQLAAVGGDGDYGTEDLPSSFTARCRAFGAADCDDLLASLPDILAAAEDNTSKLIGLQEYVRDTLETFDDQSAASGTVTTAPALSGDGVEVVEEFDAGGSDGGSQD